jgi:hypothetical protein
MTTAAFNLTWDNTSDATFRVYASALDTQILAMGWVHSTDTGQANLATMTRTTTLGANYIIYKTNDGVSPPIYMRMEFYSPSSTAQPGFAVQAGFATDGAGNLTGTAVTGRWITSNGTSDTTPRTCVISGSSSRLTLSINMSASSLNNSTHLSIERNKTSAGADTNTGLILTMLSGFSGLNIAGNASRLVAMLYLPTTGGVPSIEFLLPCILTNNLAGASTFGSTTGAAVPIPLAGAAQNPGLNHLICLAAECPSRDTTVTLAMYDGSNHTYYVIGPNWPTVAGIAGQTAGSATTKLLQSSSAQKMLVKNDGKWDSLFDNAKMLSAFDIPAPAGLADSVAA